jgi:tRNA (mo5U34)-methyltransferase
VPELGIVHRRAVSEEHFPSLAAGWRQTASLLPNWSELIDGLEARILAHGDASRWLDALRALPAVTATAGAILDGAILDGVSIGARSDLGNREFVQLEQALRALHPWRKGPFWLFGLHVDTEWRSDWKWQRLAPHLRNIDGALVCDVGSGNGYYGWRLLDAGARQVVGIDPTIVFAMQHEAIARYMGKRRAAANCLLPVRLEDLPPSPAAFDVVLSMGVIYHRREPKAHLRDLVGRLKAGGQLVIETLIFDTDDVTERCVLVPATRYARMRNVWQVPSRASLEHWLCEAGLSDVALVNVAATTTDEQRSTPWMRFESLAEGLDLANPSMTTEGYPAPLRAIAVGTR